MRNGIFVVLVLFSVACKENYDAPCRKVVTNYVDFTASELVMWPYKANDTLQFVNQLGDTVHFYNTVINHWYDLFSQPNNPECADDSIGYENRFVATTDTVNMFSFYTDIQMLPEIVTVSTSTTNWEFRFSAFYSKDSANFDTLYYSGNKFAQVYALKATNGDSLYYAPKHGIIRYATPVKKLTLLK